MNPNIKARIAVLAAAVIADKIRDWPSVAHPNAVSLIIGTDIADALAAEPGIAEGLAQEIWQAYAVVTGRALPAGVADEMAAVLLTTESDNRI